MKRIAGLVAAFALITSPALAVDPEDRLADPAQEARARELSRDLRCLVCAGQTVDESSAPVAKALRKMVRDRIAAGDSDEQVLEAVAKRYGEYALLKPRFDLKNFALWAGPFLVLALGAFGAIAFIRRAPASVDAAPLSDAEREALAKLDEQ
jgi:cytochrome c-type biogenesis protein CcmH